MTTTDKHKPSGKPRQRSQKGSQRGQKPEPQQSPKLDQRDEDQISPMGASTDAPTNGAAASANAPLIGEVAPADAPSIGAAAPADALSIGAAALADAPSIGAAAPADAPSIGAVAPADTLSIGGAATADDCPVSIQTIANAYVDYTRKSLQENRSFVEKLMGVRSFENAIEVQTEFARHALANFVAESQKICELYGKLATQIFRPWEGLAVKVTQAGR
jgi:Phasin protein